MDDGAKRCLRPAYTPYAFKDRILGDASQLLDPSAISRHVAVWLPHEPKEGLCDPRSR